MSSKSPPSQGLASEIARLRQENQSLRARLGSSADQPFGDEAAWTLGQVTARVSDGLAVYQAVDQGRDFIIVDINPAGERLSRVRREEVVGQRLSQVFPGVGEMGLMEVLRQVWLDGQPRSLPLTQYQDDHLVEWVENHVFRTPQGLVVAVYSDSSELRRAVLELSESQGRYSTLFEHAPISVWEEDFSAIQAEFQALRRQGVADLRAHLDAHPGEVARLASLVRIIDVNQESVRFFKLSGKDELLLHLPDFFDGESLKVFKEELITLFGGRVFFQDELPILDMEGQRRELLLRLAVCPGHEHNLGRVLVSFVDITQRKRAEQALRASEEKFRTLFDSASDAIFIHDMQGRFLEVNQAACDRLGYAREELLGLAVPDIDDPASAAMVPDNLDRLRREGRLTLEGAQVTRGGQVFPVEIKACLFNFQGQPAVLAMARDISERRLADQALRRSEARFRALFEQAPLAYQSLDSDGMILEVNQAWLKTLGYERGQVLGKWFGDFLAEGFVPHFEANFPCFKQAGFINEVEFEMSRVDGGTIAVSFNGAVGTDEQGRFRQTHCIFHDITERKRAEEEKARLEEQLRQAQKMQAVGTLAGGIAHDFNNILAMVMGHAELAQDLSRSGRPNLEELDNIIRASERGRDLVRQMLTFGRKVKAEPRPLDLNKSVQHALAMLDRALPKMIALRTSLAPDLWPVSADPTQVDQVVINLATNARDAMPQGGRLLFQTSNLTVDEELSREHLEVGPGRYVRLEVIDTGLGMSDEVRQQIFDPFFTTKEVGKGTGLGLSVVYGIVKQHQGQITCRCQPGQGTCFEMLLPAAGLAETLPPVPPASQALQTAPAGGSELILLVDDEDNLRELAASALRGAGYGVDQAGSGEEALAIMERSSPPPDLIILDLGMPGMGGHQCLLRIMERAPRSRVLIASGYPADGQVQESLAAGALGYVAKPFRRLDLLGRVRQTLDLSRRD